MHSRTSTIFSATITLAVYCLMPALAVAQNTTCINGVCYTCNGNLQCTNNVCTCNGVPLEGGGSPPGNTQGQTCGGQPTAPHPNGGGPVSTRARVASTVFVSPNSIVCGTSTIDGNTRVINGAAVNGNSSVSGDTLIDGSSINGASRVTNSAITRSAVNGASRVSQSTIVNSSLNGAVRVENSTVRNSTINGNARIIGQDIDGRVINN